MRPGRTENKPKGYVGKLAMAGWLGHAGLPWQRVASFPHLTAQCLSQGGHLEEVQLGQSWAQSS